MNWEETLTPKNTEEIKPGLFVQAIKKNPSSIEYKVVNPICWDGKYRWKHQFSWKNLVWVILIAFLAWTYQSETQFSRQLQEDPCELLENITNYCYERDYKIGDNYGEENYPVIIQDYP